MVQEISLLLEDFGIDSKNFKFNNNIKIDGESYDSKSKLVTPYDVLDIDLLPLFLDSLKDNYFKPNKAYILDSKYYIYRGEANSKNVEGKKPGIYKDISEERKSRFFLIEPTTDSELEEYSTKDKISHIHTRSIIDQLNRHQDILIAIPESTKIFQPQITENDDILKVIAKRALQMKNVDLDRYKDRFSNKNELFNFKQVLRSDNKLSMKIFMRGMEALNLVFTIIVSERSTNNVVGDPLTEPIETSSEETYPLCA